MYLLLLPMGLEAAEEVIHLLLLRYFNRLCFGFLQGSLLLPMFAASVHGAVPTFGISFFPSEKPVGI